MNTTENNKKIAEFMEASKGIKTLFYLPQFRHYQNSYGQIDYVEVFREDELKYHNNWNWLMSVIAKIEKIEGVYDIEEFLLIRDELCTARMKTVYESVINFIDWYNKNGAKEN